MYTTSTTRELNVPNYKLHRYPISARGDKEFFGLKGHTASHVTKTVTAICCQ